MCVMIHLKHYVKQFHTNLQYVQHKHICDYKHIYHTLLLISVISLQFHFLFKFVNHEKFKVEISSQSLFIEGGF